MSQKSKTWFCFHVTDSAYIPQNRSTVWRDISCSWNKQLMQTICSLSTWQTQWWFHSCQWNKLQFLPERQELLQNNPERFTPWRVSLERADQNKRRIKQQETTAKKETRLNFKKTPQLETNALSCCRTSTMLLSNSLLCLQLVRLHTVRDSAGSAQVPN